MDRARAALNNLLSSARTQTFVAFHSLTLTVFTLAFQNYQLWQLPIPPFRPFLSHFVSNAAYPPFFCLKKPTKNQHLKNCHRRLLPGTRTTNRYRPLKAPRVSAWIHAASGDLAIGRCFQETPKTKLQFGLTANAYTAGYPDDMCASRTNSL